MISALVLAAGQSRRMGTQKLLLPFHGQPLIAKVVDEVLLSPVDQVIVVIGKEGKSIQDAIAGRDVCFVTNTSADAEMLQSVRSGLIAMPQEADAVILALGDQPGVTSELIKQLVQAFRTTGRGIVVPTHNGMRGHPLLFATHYRDEILTQFEGCGLRGLLAAHPHDVHELEVATSIIFEDIDLPEDYQRALDRGC